MNVYVWKVNQSPKKGFEKPRKSSGRLLKPVGTIVLFTSAYAVNLSGLDNQVNPPINLSLLTTKASKKLASKKKTQPQDYKVLQFKSPKTYSFSDQNGDL